MEIVIFQPTMDTLRDFHDAPLFKFFSILSSDYHIYNIFFGRLGFFSGKLCSVFGGFSVGFFPEIVENGSILPNLIDLRIKVSGWGSRQACAY
jgi:hypothetical protein